MAIKMRELAHVIEDRIKKKKMKERTGRRRRRKKASSTIMHHPIATDYSQPQQEQQQRLHEADAVVIRRKWCNRNKKSPTSPMRPLLALIQLSLLIGLTDFAFNMDRGALAAPGSRPAQELGEGLTLAGSRPPAQSPLGSTPSPQQLEKIKRDNKVSALVGQNVILNCAVHFKDGVEEPFVVNWLKYPNQLPIYIWYAGYPAHVAQGYESRVSRIGQASLNLSQVRDSDQGLYLCKINYLDKGPEDRSTEIWNWMFLDVQAPPRFTQSPAPINYVQAGDSLHLTCQAESTPAPVMRWYKNKTPIDSDQGPYRLSSSSSAAASSTGQPPGGNNNNGSSSGNRLQLWSGHQSSQLDLFIDNVQAGSTTGDYRCLASNSEGSIEARSQVVQAVPAVITSMPAEQTALEGDKVELSCQARALPSNITYKWLFNDKPIGGLRWFEGRHSLKRDGTLIIHSVHRDDQGYYKCQATNGLSHRLAPPAVPAPSSAAPKRPQAGGKPAGSEPPPAARAPIYAEAGTQLHVEYMARITHSPAVQYLPMGLSGLVRCFFQAQPPAKYYAWTFNDQQFDPDKDPNVERLNNGSLLVHRVSKQYEGKYMCAAFNKHGSAGTSAPMEVRVEEPPRFEQRPAEFYKAPVNGHVKIPCEASGSPKPTITWRRVLGPAQAAAAAAAAAARPASVTGGRTSTTSSTTTTTTTTVLAPINDEAAGDADEQHFYSSTNELAPSQQQQQPSHEHGHGPALADATEASQVAPMEYDEQQSVMMNYAKLPSDRSEYKSSHLLLHALRKDDLGRYECVAENEVATLVASTMLYIEETTPHAPTNLQVETKAWSAHLSWAPGYDGGFEQSFVIWYRQVERPPAGEEDELGNLPPVRAQPAERRELIDLNWRSLNVQPSDATSFVVHNLSQDTSYEFYVRAKNIIGDGPGSQPVLATTRRAISGSLAPVNVMELASSGDGASLTDGPDPKGQTASPAGDEDEDAGFTVNPSVVSIIHLVDLTTPTNQMNAASDAGSDTQSSASQTDPGQPSVGPNGAIQNNNNNKQQTLNNNDPLNSGSNSTKVIRIYRPNKPQASSSGSSDQNSLSNSGNTNKRPRQPDQSSASLNTNTSSSSPDGSSQATQEAASQVVDKSTAPQNVSMSKVAQGWVINWWPPVRPVAITDTSKQSPMPALSQVQANSDPIGGAGQSVAAYSVEYREKSSPNWVQLATSRERSLLLKDLKPGAEYLFRVYALASSGARGAPSDEFKYVIPDNRRKPGSTQALSAGVVSGVLFFIACIVIAVCTVQMCNKRRKKRAEKAAYVMMACPVLESHHDIAALNSNSLLKNSCSPKEGRVPGVNGFSHQPGSNHSSAPSDGPLARLAKFAARARTRLARSLDIDAPCPAGRPTGQCPDAVTSGNLDETDSAAVESPIYGERRIEYSSNAPLPVDVSPTTLGCQLPEASAADQPQPQQQHADGPGTAASTTHQSTPIDDYWIRRPSDRKWGTLTLAGSRLAERRAREAADKQLRAQEANKSPSGGAPETAAEVDSLAGEYYAPAVNQPAASRTLPRSFGASPSATRNAQLDGHLQAQNQSRHQQFNSWLQDQLRTPNLLTRQQQQQQLPPPQLTQTCSEIHQNRQQQRLWAPQAQQHQLQPQFHHQRSISHVEPAQLANYWLLRHPNLPQLNANLGEQPHWAGVSQPTLLYHHQTQPTGFSTLQPNFYAAQQQHPQLSAAYLHQQQQANGQLQQAPFASWMIDTNDATAIQQQLPIGKRNSVHRSTLPMAAAAAGSAPPCAFYPIVVAGPYDSSPSADNEPPPLPAKPGSCVRDDDPVTANACLGSYKRKRRLPHIEAQFTITPPEPSKASLGAQLDARTAASREREAVASGHLFVRAIGQDSTATSGGGQNNTSPRPRGMPQAGQRREQRQLREQSESPLGRVETIGAREKIETYLRHYHDHEQARRRNRQQQRQSEGEISPASETSTPPDPSGSSPIQLDQVKELTFQPYHNLPSLKYTISLPLCRARDGTLLLNETSHLRRSRRARRNSDHAPGDSSSSRDRNSNTLTFGETAHRQRRPKRKPLGSSSSCPAPPAEFCGELPPRSAASSLRPLACSLESAIDQPTLGHPELSDPVDSLEHSLQALCAPTCAANPTEEQQQRQRQVQQPFYLRSRTTSPADYSSIRETLMVEVPSPPPPVPPHRTTMVANEKPGKGSAGRCQRPEPDFGLSAQSQHIVAVNGEARESMDIESSGDSSSSSSSEANSSSSRSPGSSSESHSAQNLLLSSSSSSSRSTNTENGGSEVLTNDHSVDENYEFDQVSSCSSSIRPRRQPNSDSPTMNGRLAPPQQQQHKAAAKINQVVNGVIYSQVNKRQRGPKGQQSGAIDPAGAIATSRPVVRTKPEESVVVVMRSQIYEESRRKEQPLNKATTVKGDSR